MIQKFRLENLRLARHLCDGLGNLVARLEPLTNSAELIKMGQKKKDIRDSVAREIEKIINLPAGWMDRDNLLLLKMTELEFQIYSEVANLHKDAQKGLLALISSRQHS